jgi:hypothetical protein
MLMLMLLLLSLFLMLFLRPLVLVLVLLLLLSSWKGTVGALDKSVLSSNNSSSPIVIHLD